MLSRCRGVRLRVQRDRGLAYLWWFHKSWVSTVLRCTVPEFCGSQPSCGVLEQYTGSLQGEKATR